MITRAQRDDTESSRLDNFVDGAFAFAVTMLGATGWLMNRYRAHLQQSLPA